MRGARHLWHYARHAARSSGAGRRKERTTALPEVSIAMPAVQIVRDAPPRTAPLTSGFGLLINASPGESLTGLGTDEVLGSLRDHGVLMLRGFGADRASFEQFTLRFASEFVLPMMRVARPKLNGGADAKTAHVDVGSHAMGLHQELSFTPVRPEAIWLWCEKTAGRGGETTVADGVALYERLSETHKQLFRTKRLKYTFGGTVEGVAELFRVAPADLPATLRGLAGALTYTQDGNTLSFTYLTSALQKTKFGGATTFANFVLFSQTAAACGHPEAARVTGLLRFEDDQPIPSALVAELSAIAEPLTHAIKWQAGDLMMIDNTRMMHGRRAFEPDSGRTVFYRAARELLAR
jgi:alpha-ketoglutarate-dependent taurine dioxygenase